MSQRNCNQRFDEKTKGIALKCLGGYLTLVSKDPDPKAGEKYQEEMNCENCSTSRFCKDTLEFALNHR